MVHKRAITKSFYKNRIVKKSCFRFFLAISIPFFSLITPAKAQTAFDLVVKGDAVDQVIDLQNTTGADLAAGREIQVQLQAGVLMYPGSLVDDTGLSNGARFQRISGDDNAFVLRIDKVFPANEVAKIRFKRIVGCVTQQPDVEDKAYVIGHPNVNGKTIYHIWEPIMYPMAASSTPTATAVAGQAVDFSFTVWNSALNSYTSNFTIAVNHTGFERPTNLVLAMNGVTQPANAADVTVLNDSNIEVRVTTAMLRSLGQVNGRISTGEQLKVDFKATPKVGGCSAAGSPVSVKIATRIADCPKVTADPMHNINLNILSPGAILSTFNVQRRNFDYPDSNDSRTVNGVWSWSGGSVDPPKDQVRNGDTLELKLAGTIYTSPLLQSIEQLYADIRFSDVTHNEFLWNSQLKVRVNPNGTGVWTDYSMIADVISNAGYIRYRMNIPGGVVLTSGDKVEIVITAVMKNDATANVPCTLSADMFAAKSSASPESGYPAAGCRLPINSNPLKRVVMSNDFLVTSPTIIGSCTFVTSSVKFSSKETSSPLVGDSNYFQKEFRSNHYAKNIQVYIAKEGTLQTAKATFDGGAASTLTLPSPTSVTFTANSNTYVDAKCYTFSIENLYGTYGDNLSKFKDEELHELVFDFDVSYNNQIGGAGQVSAIMYAVTPVNPSVPNTIQTPKSAIQSVVLPSISPELTVSPAPGSDVTIIGGVATWRLNLKNPNSSLDLDNVSLLLDNITSGSFLGLVVKLNGAIVPIESGNIARLGIIARNSVHNIEIEATIAQACNEREDVRVVLRNEPCGGAAENINSVDLTYKAPISTVQVTSTLVSTNLTMCDEFTVKMVVSASEGIVKDPKVVLVFPKNISGAVGVTHMGVKIGGAPYNGAGVSGGVTDISFDLKDIVGGVTQLEAGNPLNNKFELEVTLKPNCDFPVNARLVSYAYGKNYCNSYNSKGSGTPVSTGELTIAGLQSTYSAGVQFSEPVLKFDKLYNQKPVKLSIRKLSGGSVGPNDVVSLTMPAAVRLVTNPSGAAEITTGTGIDVVRIVTWPAPLALSATPTEYDLVFVMDTPATPTDLLSSTISVVVINKVEGLPCNGLIPPFCPSIETKAGESSIAFEVVDIFPALAKSVSQKANSLLNYDFTYTFTIGNLSAYTVNNLRLYDDLNEFYSKGTVSAINITTSSANISVNPLYDGKTDTQLLGAGSLLLPNDTQTATLSFNIVFDEAWKNSTFTITNTATTIGTNENGTEYENNSNSGTNPDLTEMPTITDPIDTNPPEVIVEPIIVTPPPGFSITVDGVECFEGNEGTQTPLEFEFKLKSGTPLDYNLCFTVYTEDGIATLKDNDYVKLTPRVICIDAGKVRADETIAVTIVGDDKYEKDEWLTLQVKPTTEQMLCKPPVITILNDDAKPSVVIDDVILDPSVDNGIVPNVADFSGIEGTSDTERTKFPYSVKLNIPAPQPLVLRVVAGSGSDTATPDKDYYASSDIVLNIPAGSSEASFIIEVEPDKIPENDELFTLSFSLEAEGVSFLEEVRRTVIIDDDKLEHNLKSNVLTYCAGDDAVTQQEKLSSFISIPVGYEPRWYETATAATPIAEPVNLDSTKLVHEFWLGVYSADENYETPVGAAPAGGRVKVSINLLNSYDNWSITSTPISSSASPMKLLPGQSVSVTAVTGNNLPNYSFILNGTQLTSGEKNEVIVNGSKLSEQNTMEVVVVDFVGCVWSKNLDMYVEYAGWPNAFIPEGDDIENKLFLKGYDIRVYNRWGHLLYQGTEGWDGRYKGSFVASGSYYYVVSLRQADGSLTEEKGYVMVVGIDS